MRDRRTWLSCEKLSAIVGFRPLVAPIYTLQHWVPVSAYVV
jgi:hypothetical protein